MPARPRSASDDLLNRAAVSALASRKAMVTFFLLAVALAVAPQQREPVAPETAEHVACILAGADAEVGDEEDSERARRASILALAALSEAEAVDAVRALLTAPRAEFESYGWGGRLRTGCSWDHQIGLPVAEDYVANPLWLEDGPAGARRGRGIESFPREPHVIGCLLIQGWGEGSALVPELRALLRGTDRRSAGTEAARALGARRHPGAIQDLVAAVDGGHVGACAIVALSKFGPVADASVFALLRSGRSRIEEPVLWYVARHAARVPSDVLEGVAASLAGDHHRKALTALVQAGMRSEGLLLRELARGRSAQEPVAAERALAGLILLPGRTGPAFPTLLAIARDGSAASKTRALALRYVAESPAGVALLSELIRLAETPGDVMVRTAAARALGRLPAVRPTARDVALAIAASDAPDRVCIAALRSAVDCDPSAAMRTRLELISRDRKAPSAVRSEADSLISRTQWRD